MSNTETQATEAGNGDKQSDAPSARAQALREEMLGSALALDEVAYVLGLDRTTVARYLRDGTIYGFQIGREWLVPESELRKYMQTLVEGRRSHAQAPTTTPQRGVFGRVRDDLQRLSRRKGHPELAWPSADKFRQFTNRARRVLELAQAEAQAMQHNYIGTEHLLLGMIREGDGVAARMLAHQGVEYERVRNGIEFVIGRGDSPVEGAVGLTPRSKKVIELAVSEARILGHHYIGTEHLLLGLLHEGEGIAAGVLETLGIDFEAARREILHVLGQHKEALEPVAIRPIPAEAATLLKSSESHLACSRCAANSPAYFRFCFHCGNVLQSDQTAAESAGPENASGGS